MSSEYSLPFLKDLRTDFNEQDVEDLWRGRTFPLVRTRDFAKNWASVRDSQGLFTTPSGHRYRVEPQPHYIKYCRPVLMCDGVSRALSVLYEAIIFSKVTRRLWVGGALRERELNPQSARRRLVDDFLKKLPRRWRELIIKGDLGRFDGQEQEQLGYILPNSHPPLSDPRNIRLVTIIPCLESYKPIECRTNETNLSSNPHYEALSYVWGSPESPRTILLNGKDFLVTQNLEAALRQLRPHDGDPRTIWIDAICIDQRNGQERDEQVGRMDSIYRSAAGVIAWLGQESHTSVELLTGLSLAGEILKNTENITFPPSPSGSPFVLRVRRDHQVPQELPAESLESALQQLVNKMSRMVKLSFPDFENATKGTLVEWWSMILHRPWWKRVWILQEAVSAKKLTLTCGCNSVEWTEFQALLDAFIRNGVFESNPQFALLQHQVRYALAIVLLRNMSLIWGEEKVPHLADLLSITEKSTATDPRDRLFALVSLLPPDSTERSELKPNYSVNPRWLYVQTAKNFLSRTRKLDVLMARGPLPAVEAPSLIVNERRIDVPSWVPDWSLPQVDVLSSVWINDFSPSRTYRPYMTSHPNKSHTAAMSLPDNPGRDEDKQVFNASLQETSPFKFRFSEYDEVLHVDGVTVDFVEEVSQRWGQILKIILEGQTLNLGMRERHSGEFIAGHLFDSLSALLDRSSKSDQNSFRSLIEEWKDIARLGDDDTLYTSTHQSRREAFWRTVFLDRHYDRETRNGDFHIARMPAELQGRNFAEFMGVPNRWCSIPPKDEVEEIFLLKYLSFGDLQGLSIGAAVPHSSCLKFFRTTKGYIGVAHPRLQVGDKVVVVFGSPVPLILREYPEGHAFMGQSYVHGVMDGEIIQAKRDEGCKGREDFEEFAII